MANKSRILGTALSAALLPGVIADFALFEPGLISNSSNVLLSKGCVDALQSNMRCDPYLQKIVSTDTYSYLDPSLLDTLCTADCGHSLASYHASVKLSCVNDPLPWPGTPPELYGDQIWAAYNMTCLKDTSNGYCQNYFANLTVGAVSSIADLPKDVACSPCVLKLGQLNQATSYSNYGERMAKEWASLQSRCGVSFPTAVQPIVGNRTDIPGYAPPNYPVAACLSGKAYAVISGDDCGKIATAHSVPRGALMSLNNILPDCSDLRVGASLCLPQTCQLYRVQPGDSCVKIANASRLTYTQLLAWNPFLNPTCTNLIAGDGVCVGQPGTVWTGSTISGATATKTAVYAAQTVAPPGAVAHGTTLRCGKYYKAQSGDNCYLIALNNTITMDLFEQINPDINTACSNLNQGLYYCVEPTADWNATDSSITTTSSYVSAPAPTPRGTTSQCYQYYTVQSGDYCGKLESAFGITMPQLQLWNPDLKNDCSNLQLGNSYCVQGGQAAASVGAVAQTATTSASIRNA